MNLKELKKEQLKLAKKIIIKDIIEKIDTIGAADNVFFDNKMISVIIVMKLKDMQIVEEVYTINEVKMPYIPGYQAYREAPGVINTYNNLKNKPDILLIKGNGILHPRGIGIASHIGLLLNQVTIGISKELLCGEEKEGKVYIDNKLRAIKLETKEHANPIYISPGYKISLKKSVEIIKDLVKGHKLPEPMHIAHKYAIKIRELENKN